MRLVGVRLLLEHDVAVHQSLVQNHALLVVHVVVRGPVYQHVLFPTYALHPSAHVRVVVAALVVLGGGQAHEPFRVQRIWEILRFSLFTRKKRTWILSRNTRFCIGEDVSKRTHLRRNYRNKSRRWRVRLISHIWTPIRCRWPAPWRPRNRRNSNPIYPSCSNRSTSISAAAFCKRRFPVKPSAQDKLGERAT